MSLCLQALSNWENGARHVFNRGLWGSAEDIAAWLAKRTGSNVADHVGEVHRIRSLVAKNPKASVRSFAKFPAILTYDMCRTVLYIIFMKPRSNITRRVST